VILIGGKAQSHPEPPKLLPILQVYRNSALTTLDFPMLRLVWIAPVLASKSGKIGFTVRSLALVVGRPRQHAQPGLPFHPFARCEGI
jgi:hypothetical protein